jgi:hypothetical protein
MITLDLMVPIPTTYTAQLIDDIKMGRAVKGIVGFVVFSITVQFSVSAIITRRKQQILEVARREAEGLEKLSQRAVNVARHEKEA